MDQQQATIVIPAYEPSWRFVRLMQLIRQETDRQVIVVNDGSNHDYDIVFTQIEKLLNIKIISYPVNKGKGGALKTAFAYQLKQFPESAGIVTADSDGQHSVSDILKLCALLETGDPTELLMGTRSFSKEDVPFKSYWGNKITSKVFQLLSGIKCGDTQTGLRGIPQRLLPPLLAVEGERFEYEMNMLLAHKEIGFTLKMVPIETIYLDNNEQSHFRPVRDAIRIYWPILSYAVASIISAVFDISIFYLLLNLIWPGATNLLGITILARVSSGLINFGLNKVMVFKHKGQVISDFAKYAALFVSQLFLSWFFLQLLSNAFGHIILMKVIVDTSLFIVSFVIQRRFVFTDAKGEKEHAI